MNYEDIKTFSERCETHPDHQSGMVTEQMLKHRSQEEVDELRAYIDFIWKVMT
jgi:hypothetical protein